MDILHSYETISTPNLSNQIEKQMKIFIIIAETKATDNCHSTMHECVYVCVIEQFLCAYKKSSNDWL